MIDFKQELPNIKPGGLSSLPLIARIQAKYQTRKILGLAVEEDSILAADIECREEGYKVTNTAEFVFPEDLSFNKPETLGQALGRFLRENGLSAKKAIIGLPAKWLLIREKTLPPSSADALAGIIKIQAEHEFSLDLADMVLDYAKREDAVESKSLLLVAVLRKTMDRMVKAVQTAGLRVVSVTASSMALTDVFRFQMLPASPRYLLYIRPDYAELLELKSRTVRSIIYIDRDLEAGVASFVSELRRIISFTQNTLESEAPEGLLVWDAALLGQEDLDDLREGLSSLVDVVDGSAFPVIDKFAFSGEAEQALFAVPAALGQLTRGEKRPAIDLLNSRMSLKKTRIEKRQIMWATAIGFTLIFCCLMLILDLQRDKEEVVFLRNRLEAMSEDIWVAEDIVQKVGMARGWYSGRPRILDCLRELTGAFPEQGRIWATNLALNENMRGIVSGKATDEQYVLEVLDKLKDNPSFSDVQMVHMRENGRSSQEISFSINFAFANRG